MKKENRNISVISFTKAGSETNRILTEKLSIAGETCKGYTLSKFVTPPLYTFEENENLQSWVSTKWGKEAIVFIGAAGIAVRSITPFVKDKYEDSPVIVLDEKGQHVIPLLSGHIGGAVRLSEKIAEVLGATVIYTTATDINQVFAVDVFAKQNDLQIQDQDRILAKQISAGILEGEKIAFYSEYPYRGEFPKELTRCDSIEEAQTYRYAVSISDKYHIDMDSCMKTHVESHILQLIPKDIAVGIGCRKGVPEKDIERKVEAALNTHGYELEKVFILASIDIKKNEKGLIDFAKSKHIPFQTYTADELNTVEAVSGTSAFVKETVGTDNVCERAALMAGEHGDLIQEKTKKENVTISLVRKKYTIQF